MCFLRQPIKNEVAQGCGLDCLPLCLRASSNEGFLGKCLIQFVDPGRFGNERLLSRRCWQQHMHVDRLLQLGMRRIVRSDHYLAAVISARAVGRKNDSDDWRRRELPGRLA